MATLKPTCVFCCKKGDKILSFTQERLNKCVDILNTRKKNKLQWSHVKLPPTITDIDGYHSKCLSNFSALKAKYEQSPNDSSTCESEQQPLSAEPSTSAVTNQEIETKVIFEPTVDESGELIAATEDLVDDPAEDVEIANNKTCIFCNSKRKKSKGRWQNLTTCSTRSAIENMKSQATECNDHSLLQEIHKRLSQGHPILYHVTCSVVFNNRFRTQITGQKDKSDWHKIRQTGSAAFEDVCSFVEEHIIGNHNMYFLDFLRNMYVENLTQDMDAAEKSLQTVCTRYLEDRLLKKYPKEITVIEMKKRRIVKPYAGVALQHTDFETLEDKDVVQRAALILRRSIRGIEKKALPEKMNVSDLINGECTVPNILNNFYTTIERRCNSSKTQSTLPKTC